MTLATFIQASAHNMPQVATGSVQAIVTSPPYYGLRRYEGAQDVEWPAVEYAPMPGLSPLTVPAMRSPLGNESTLEAYIAHLILCLREWRRVLRDDGVVMVNLGDSYAGNGQSRNGLSNSVLGSGPSGACKQRDTAGVEKSIPTGLKPKDLMLVPARFALAAQADGWYLRSDIIGVKVAPMPESVTDRPTRSHEHIFMLTKRGRYFWDAEAVREPLAAATVNRYQYGWNGRNDDGSNGSRTGSAFAKMKAGATMGEAMGGSASGRNARDVLEWRPSPFTGAHFAVFPPAIPEWCIRAATSPHGACPTCGAPWARVVERTGTIDPSAKGSRFDLGKTGTNGNGRTQEGERYLKVAGGFHPTCTCPAHDPIPCIVLDPFSGSGTTVKAAVRLGRRGIGVDIAAEYLDDVTAQRFGAGVQMEMAALR